MLDGWCWIISASTMHVRMGAHRLSSVGSTVRMHV